MSFTRIAGRANKQTSSSVAIARNEAGPSNLSFESRQSPPPPSSSSWNVARRYAIIVDAGSSGSRMQVYSWKDPLVDRAQRERKGEKIKILPTVEKGTWEGSGLDWQLKVEPGLSTFGSHPQDVHSYLTPLFDHAKQIIPPELMADTPVYILATAGMRLLPEDQQKAVLQNTCSFISEKTPFNLGIGGCQEHVQVIKGEEEGLLGWIAINYLMDGFHFKPSLNDGTEGKSTFGFLDMGGASTQIAFEPSQSAQIANPDTQDDLTSVALRMLDGTDVVHKVFVTTFLGFGTNKARDRYLTSLVPSTSPSTSAITDPCLPKGLELKLPQDHTATAAISPSLVGSGSFDQCLKSLAPLLDKEAECNRPPCLFHGVHVPPIDFSVNHFIGVSEYWFSSNDVFKLGGVYDFVTFQKAAQTFCGSSWDSLTSQLKDGAVFGKQVTTDRLEMQCFKAAWMATVLHEGIGIPRITDPGGEGEGRVHADEAQGKADEKNLFQSVNDVGGLAVSWTLGKAVLEASKDIPPLPADGPNSAPVHGEPEMQQNPGTWQDKFSPAYQRPTEALLSGRNAQLPALGMFLTILVTFLAVLLCCVLRGRSPKATKRRAMLRDLFLSPWSKRHSSHGDYTLADMEEGGGVLRKRESGESLASVAETESSGDETDGFRTGKRRRRSSGNGIVTALLIPLQRLGLALGLRTNVRATSPTLPPSLAQRRQFRPRYPMRHHHISTTPITMSQPTSPKAYSAHIAANHQASTTSAGYTLSRPGSRTGSVLSPRVMHHENPLSAGSATGNPPHSSYFAAWQNNLASSHPSSTLNSVAATATASARSSRAGSPTMGHSSNPRTPGFSRKAWEELD